MNKAESLDTFKVVDFLRELPAGYDVNKLLLNGKFADYLLHAKAKGWIPPTFGPHLSPAPTGELKMAQTRSEVLWRTMIMDRCNGQYPAPSECGSRYAEMIESAIYDAYCSAVDIALKNNGKWEDKMRKALEAFAAWQWIQETSTGSLGSLQRQRMWQNVQVQGDASHIDSDELLWK
jgi:hypothetical protein